MKLPLFFFIFMMALLLGSVVLFFSSRMVLRSLSSALATELFALYSSAEEVPEMAPILYVQKEAPEGESGPLPAPLRAALGRKGIVGQMTNEGIDLSSSASDLHVGVDWKKVAAPIASVYLWISVVALSIFGAALAVIYLLLHRTLRPLVELSSDSKRLAQGEEVTISQGGELASTLRSVAMERKLAHHQRVESEQMVRAERESELAAREIYESVQPLVPKEELREKRARERAIAEPLERCKEELQSLFDLLESDWKLLDHIAADRHLESVRQAFAQVCYLRLLAGEWARLFAEPSSLHSHHISISPLLDQLVQEVAPLFEVEGHSLFVERDREAIEVESDPRLLFELLRSLLLIHWRIGGRALLLVTRQKGRIRFALPGADFTSFDPIGQEEGAVHLQVAKRIADQLKVELFVQKGGEFGVEVALR